MDDIQQTLEERGTRYGEFPGHAQISQDIQNAIARGIYGRGDGLDVGDIEPYILEALTMIAHKIGRIVNGDLYYDDSWRDIAGYATLVVNELEKSQKENQNATQELQTN